MKRVADRDVELMGVLLGKYIQRSVDLYCHICFIFRHILEMAVLCFTIHMDNA